MTNEFYDAISHHYSRDRYESGVKNSVQCTYALRLRVVLDFARRALSHMTAARILDVGTADGYVLRRVYNENAARILDMVGVDIAPHMVLEARQQSDAYPAAFVLRGHEPNRLFDFVLEVGVHMDDAAAEFAWLAARTLPRGHVIVTVANSNSLFTRFKLRRKSYAAAYRSFPEYEQMLAQHFEVITYRTMGVFVPLIWKLPARAARCIQVVVERVVECVSPSVMHERVYLLRRRPSDAIEKGMR